jgi:hypothetical protein
VTFPAQPPLDPEPQADPELTGVLQHATALYQEEIGPVTPIISRELQQLTATYPDPAEWDTAFREMSRANVPRLSYVESVLKRRASAANLPPGGKRARIKSKSTGSPRPHGDRDQPRSVRCFTPEPGDELYAAQQRAACPGEPSGAAVEPLDPLTVLGSASA